MEDKKGLITQLKHYIYQRSRVTRDELKAFARDTGHEESYMERQMRDVVKEGYIIPYPTKKHKSSHIIGYEVIKRPEAHTQPQISDKNVSWQEKLRLDQERKKIEGMRGEDGRIRVC